MLRLGILYDRSDPGDRRMPRRASCFALAFLILVPTTGEATVQKPSPTTRRDTYWLGAGLGLGSEDFGAQLNASYQSGANLFSLRIASTAGLFEDGFTDYALLYGRATRAAGERHLLGAAVGVAVVDGCRGGGFGGCQDVPAVFGLPLELQAFWRPGKTVGLGLYGFANFNRSRSFAGLTLSLQVGRLR
jgi:hypothetical protein